MHPTLPRTMVRDDRGRTAWRLPQILAVAHGKECAKAETAPIYKLPGRRQPRSKSAGSPTIGFDAFRYDRLGTCDMPQFGPQAFARRYDAVLARQEALPNTSPNDFSLARGYRGALR